MSRCGITLTVMEKDKLVVVQCDRPKRHVGHHVGSTGVDGWDSYIPSGEYQWSPA